MSPLLMRKRRNSKRTSSRTTITKNQRRTSTVNSSRHSLRSKPSAESTSPAPVKISTSKRRPLDPTVAYADRLIPFRSHVTLSEAADRQSALEKLRKITEDKKIEDASTYYITALQSEILNAPLEIVAEPPDRAVLKAYPDRCLMNFSHRVVKRERLSEVLAIHPLENGKVANLLNGEHSFCFTDRYIAKHPYKILDAPELKNDFYYNLLDWSSSNVLAVGLNSSVYMYSVPTSVVQELNGSNTFRHEVVSVNWNQSAAVLAVGVGDGVVQLWDPETCCMIRSYRESTSRVGSMSWNLNTLSAGCREGIIRHYDCRRRQAIWSTNGHSSEVCGLKWSADNVYLVSGGNDNHVIVWDIRRPKKELWRITEHSAAVKALSWSPHNYKHFVSGGGMKDLSIRMWNVNTLERVQIVNAEAQVCGLHWSGNVNEIISTHGYNTNAMKLWKAKDFEFLGFVASQPSRVLYMTWSPDGQSIATGSGDESIRFFKVFPPTVNTQKVFRDTRERINMTAR